MLKMKAQQLLPVRRHQLLRKGFRAPPERPNLRKWDPNSSSKQGHLHFLGRRTMPPTSLASDGNPRYRRQGRPAGKTIP